jgi:RNA polymerase sigma factor (sigma-70 family)
VPGTPLTHPDKQGFVTSLEAQYGGRLRRFLRLNLPNAPDVPDLAQEVFMRLLRVENYEEIRSPEAYLFTVAGHVVQQHVQRRVVVTEPLDARDFLEELALVSPQDPAAHAEVEQQLEHLGRALAGLPSRVALSLLMHLFQGYSIAEIAQELGVAQITVKKYLAKALLHCRDAFGRGETGQW